LVAARTLDPQVLGRVPLGQERQAVADAGEPAHATVFRAEWMAVASCSVRRRMWPGESAPCSAMRSMNADPTTTPSATLAIASACSGVRTPKPTATGRSVARLRRATYSPIEARAACCLPVTPATET